jgi:hypothetical protein
MEAATGDSDGKIADSESDKLLIEVVHLSVKKMEKNSDRGRLAWTIPRNFSYQEGWGNFFHTRHSGATRSIDKVLSVGENAKHGSCHSINTAHDSTISTPARPPLYLVPASDEEASRWWQAVRPLHLPEVRLPAYNKARSETTQPRTLIRFVWLIWFVLFIWLIWFIGQFRSTKKPDKPNKPNEQERLPA